MGKEPILKSHRRPDIETTVVAVRTVKFGDGSYPVIAGPAAVESEDQINAAADAVAEAGGSVLRAGTFIAGGSPYEYRGVGPDAVWMLEHAGRRAGLPVATEVLEPAHVEAAAEHIDILEVGPDNMQNFVLLREVGSSHRPVIVHRGPSATIDEWLLAAEYVLDAGNERVVLCERGSRGFDPRTTDTIDISAVPAVQRLSHLPVVVDPAPSAGDPDLLPPLALAARSRWPGSSRSRPGHLLTGPRGGVDRRGSRRCRDAGHRSRLCTRADGGRSPSQQGGPAPGPGYRRCR